MKKNLKELNKKTKKIVHYDWIVKIILLTFTISIIFSILSEIFVPKSNVILGIILVIIFILVGIVFDMLGVAITSADEKPFHSMASRNVVGAKTAVKLIKNADKASSFCNDVIGDICGIISGTAGVSIASTISIKFNINIIIISLLITALIASLTIGGKAIAKSFAVNKSNYILYNFSKLISIFKSHK